jgi:CubicO group peptidase (beta-lactamase class C family)
MFKKKYLLFFFLQLSFISAQNDFDPDQLIIDITQNKQNIGLSAGYAVNGNTVWKNSAGFACKKGKTKFTSSTLTRIASIAKPFTAVAVMQLVEQGLLDLDEPIVNYLNDFPEDKKQITLRQLLGHTAAISQYYGKKEFENQKYYANLNDAMKVFINRPTAYQPGTQFRYTSYGYVVVGRIIEVVSNMNYEDYMQNNIFNKAEMKHTGVENSQSSYENKACLYHKKKRRGRKAKAYDLSNRVPGGGFYSTLDDLLKFGNALLEEKLITKESLELMKVYQDVSYSDNKYGLGWYLYGTAPHEDAIIGHGGAHTGCTSQLLIVPETNTVAVVLSNTSNNSDDIFNLTSSLISLTGKTD